MNKTLITLITICVASTAFAFTVNPTPIPPKRPKELKTTPANPTPKAWLPPIEIQGKVAPTKK